MPVLQIIPYEDGTFFITFTCYNWLPLIDKTNGYDIIYNWFDHLKSKSHKIHGFVIMLNHVHALISFVATKKCCLSEVLTINGYHFDWKFCNSNSFIIQKMNYMHENSCTGNGI